MEDEVLLNILSIMKKGNTVHEFLVSSIYFPIDPGYSVGGGGRKKKSHMCRYSELYFIEKSLYDKQYESFSGP